MRKNGRILQNSHYLALRLVLLWLVLTLVSFSFGMVDSEFGAGRLNAVCNYSDTEDILYGFFPGCNFARKNCFPPVRHIPLHLFRSVDRGISLESLPGISSALPIFPVRTS